MIRAAALSALLVGAAAAPARYEAPGPGLSLAEPAGFARAGERPLWVRAGRVPAANARLAVRWHGPDDEEYGGAEDFVTRHRRRLIAVPGETAGAPRRERLAGRNATAFTRVRLVPAQPGRLASDIVRLREEFWVVEAGGGFYVLSFTAEDRQYPKLRRHFARVLASARLQPSSRPARIPK